MRKLLFKIILLSVCLNCTAQKSITFEVDEMPTNTNPKHVGVRGDTPPLSWEKTIFLNSSTAGSSFETSVEFSDSIDKIEYKFVIDDGENVVWEGIGNRSETLNAEKQRFISEWDTEKVIDPESLPKLPVAQLQEDFEVIQNAILKVHPGLYRYNDSLSVQNNLATLKESLQQPLTYGESFLEISKFITTIQCDHTSASYFNQDAIMTSLLHEQENKIPFTFVWIDERMIVTRNASESEMLTTGAEVLEINAVPVSEILNGLLPYISADGATVSNKISKAEVDGYDFRYSSFDVLYPLLFPFKNNSLEILVKSPGETQSQKARVATITRKQRKRILASKYPDFESNAEDLWSYSIPEDNIGYLRIGSFGTNMFQKDWKKMLAEAFILFKEKDVQNLILDIRENQGGQDEAAYELEKYLYKKECTNEGFQSQSRFLKFPEDVKDDVTTWDTWFYNLEEDEHYKEGKYFVFPKDQSARNLGPTATTFNGKLIVLTSSKNVSGAFYLARLLKKCGVATLVGQETGGNLKGINGGAILFLKPPNSRININLPVIGSFSTKEMLNEGVKPDIAVKKEVGDIANNVDAELQKALKILKRK